MKQRLSKNILLLSQELEFCVRGTEFVLNCFVRVNIEDDVYIQSDKANTSTELDFDEFFEVLARMYQTRYEREHGSSDSTFDPLELDRYSTIQQLSRALAESVSDLNSGPSRYVHF